MFGDVFHICSFSHAGRINKITRIVVENVCRPFLQNQNRWSMKVACFMLTSYRKSHPTPIGVGNCRSKNMFTQRQGQIHTGIRDNNMFNGPSNSMPSVSLTKKLRKYQKISENWQLVHAKNCSGILVWNMYIMRNITDAFILFEMQTQAKHTWKEPPQKIVQL